MRRKRKTSSCLEVLIRAVVFMLIITFVLGAVRDILEDQSSNVGGSGSKPPSSSTVPKPKPTDCAHRFSFGICEKCSYICPHDSIEIAEDGNEYCTVCGFVASLETPQLRVSSNIVSWDPIPYAQTYSIFVNGEPFGSVSETLFIFTPETSGVYEISVKAEVGAVSSARSAAVSLAFYDVKYNENGHAALIASDGNLFTVESSAFSGHLTPLNGYVLPESISVMMDGVQLGADRYVYDSITGELMILGVTGEVYVDFEAPAIAVPTLTLKGSVLSWNTVPYARDYHVHVLDRDYIYDEYFEISETSFDLASLNLSPGVYYVSVWVDTGTAFGEPAGITYTLGDDGAPLKLETPFIYFQ